MVVTEKRHMYETGTVNVETGNVAVKQDINYYNANIQSATRSIIRMMEDMDRRFSQNQIYDGATVSNGSSTVDVASGTLKIGGRWVSLSGTGISAAVSDDIYFVVAQVTGVSETNSRDPSGGEAVTLTLVASGSYSATDWKLVLGSAVIASSGVTSVQDRAKRQINASIIKPYGNATQVSIYTGDAPVYREAIRFTADKIYPYNDIESVFDITGNNVSGTTLDISGQSNFNQVSGTSFSGSTFGATSYAVGSEVLDYSEFQHLVGLDQPLDTTQSPTFVQITATITGSNAPLIVSGTGTVTNLSADTVRGRTVLAGATGDILLSNFQDDILNKNLVDNSVFFASQGDLTKQLEFQLDGFTTSTKRVWTFPDRNDTIVGLTGTQSLTNKTLVTPTLNTPIIASYKSGTHDHSNDDGGSIFDLNNLSGTLAVDKGGLGVKNPTDGAFLLGGGSGIIEITARPTAAQILVGASSGSPQFKVPAITLTGDASGSDSMDANGAFSIAVTNVQQIVVQQMSLIANEGTVALVNLGGYESQPLIKLSPGDAVTFIYSPMIDNLLWKSLQVVISPDATDSNFSVREIVRRWNSSTEVWDSYGTFGNSGLNLTLGDWYNFHSEVSKIIFSWSKKDKIIYTLINEEVTNSLYVSHAVVEYADSDIW